MIKEKNAAVRFSQVGESLIAQITGEIDHHTAKHLREEIDGQMYALSPKEVTIGLSGVSFMDSSGLGLVVGRLVTAKEVGCTLTLTGVDARTMRIFEMAGLERMRGLTICRQEKGKTKNEKNV